MSQFYGCLRKFIPRAFFCVMLFQVDQVDFHRDRDVQPQNQASVNVIMATDTCNFVGIFTEKTQICDIIDVSIQNKTPMTIIPQTLLGTVLAVDQSTCCFIHTFEKLKLEKTPITITPQYLPSKCGRLLFFLTFTLINTRYH